jgi:hypothetical protein
MPAYLSVRFGTGEKHPNLIGCLSARIFAIVEIVFKYFTLIEIRVDGFKT